MLLTIKQFELFNTYNTMDVFDFTEVKKKTFCKKIHMYCTSNICV